jgi:L-rhamnose mutarotase
MAAEYSSSFSSKPQHVVWREHYRQNRYGRYLKQDELNWRFRDILFNLVTLTAEGKIGVLAKEPSAGRWWELMTHVQEEFAIRHGPYPAGFTRDILHS